MNARKHGDGDRETTPAPPPLHQMDADDQDENVKQLGDCSRFYLSLQVLPLFIQPFAVFFFWCVLTLSLSFLRFFCRIAWSKAIAAGKNAKWVRPIFNLFEVAVKCHPELRWIEWRSVCFWLSGAMLQILWSGAWQWGLWWNKKSERCNLFIRFCKMWWHSEPA